MNEKARLWEVLVLFPGDLFILGKVFILSFEQKNRPRKRGLFGVEGAAHSLGVEGAAHSLRVEGAAHSLGGHRLPFCIFPPSVGGRRWSGIPT